ncbi:MAG: protein kinase, partial [Planctomycetota bacterium]
LLSRLFAGERVFARVVYISDADGDGWFRVHYPNDSELRSFVESLIVCDRDGPEEMIVDVAGASAHRTGTPEIPGWDLLESIGEGGMGRVYLANDLGPLKRRAAIKVLKRGLDTDEILKRFESERRTLARMQHPGIATVYEAGATDDGRPYVALELVDGVPITDHCQERSLGLDERLTLFIHVCEAIQHAHHKGSVHRDLKPSNILVVGNDDEPRVKVIDFGIAKAIDSESGSQRTRMGQILGTLNYMSPEQIEGGDVDVRTDVFALGLLLYTLLTDKPPYEVPEDQSRSLEAWRSVIVDGPTPRPSTVIDEARSTEGVQRLDLGLRRDLDWIVLKALDKDPQRRYASATALADDVLRYRRREPIVARPPTVGYRVTRFVDRYRGVVIATALVFFSLVAGLVGSIWGVLESSEQARIAGVQAEDAFLARQEASLVAGFLSELINVAPGAPNREETTLREAVDAAAAKIDRNFSENPRVAALVHLAVGRAYSGLQRFDDAREHLERAVSLNEPWIHSSSERTVLHRAACRSLALIERQASRLDLAKGWVARGLAPEALGDPTDSMARVALLGERAQIYLKEGRVEEGERLLREVFEEQEQFVGIEREILNTLGLLALVAQQRGNLEEAARLFGEALDDAIQFHGPDHALTCRAYFNHAAALRRVGRVEEAERGYLSAVESARNVWGDTSHDLAFALQGLAHLKRSSGQRLEACRRYSEALEVLERVYGRESAASASLRNSLGSLLIRLGDLEAAERVLEANQRILRDGGAQRGRQFELCQLWIADLRTAQGRLGDAESVLDDWYQAVPESRRKGGNYVFFSVLRAELARREERLGQARERLAELAKTLGVPEAIEDPLVAAMPSTAWRCCRARLERDEGNLELARAVARKGWERLTPSSPLSARISMMLCLVEILERDGSPEYHTELDALIREVEERSGEEDPWIAELEAARRIP